MRIVAVAMAALLVAATALAASGGGNHPPKLIVVRTTVRGVQFAASEQVTITFGAGERHARTSASGRFATPLPVNDPCLGTTVVVARGATGDIARLKLPQRACPPALKPTS